MQAGALIFGLDWKTMKSTPLKFVLPISAGYILIGFIFGSISYLATLAIIKNVKRRKNADK
jgi:hypothetical protein